ncbi:hypothetical protein QR680_009768 [Steinernema hermaphroditum]|uniref:Uncharacterized protein n=1 Tax=Steinernema hermaphroditum TaxID=289476 RepID=A0AA39ILK9_9BILA|nr:hypothetical protein QR680_009768 [Steinernema hermaphroditum]
MDPERRELNIFVVGECGVGKTSLLERYIRGDFTQRYSSTLAMETFQKDAWDKNRKIRFQLWDTSGHERMNLFSPSLLQSVDGVVYVYDVKSFDSFESLKKRRQKFLQQLAVEVPEKIPAIVVGNKIDEECGRYAQVDDAYVKKFCCANGAMPFFEWLLNM